MTYSYRVFWAAMMLLFSYAAAFSQQQVLAKADINGVWVRWTQPNLKNTNGHNIYRQAEGAADWVLVTQQPLVFGQYDLSSDIAQNPKLKESKDLADGLRDKNKMEGIGLAMVLTTAVESRVFSQYLGILYQDKSAEKGKTYRYEVREVVNGVEKSLGVSDLVQAGKLVPGKGIEEIKTKEGDAQLSFGWKVDEAQHVGAYIYYKLGGGSWQKMNKKIILPSKLPNKGGERSYPEYLFTKDSLQNGQTYTIMIKGVDLFGFETDPSQEFKLTPQDKTPPPAVDKLGINVVLDRVAITWELPKSNGVAGIRIYRQKGLDSTWVLITEDPLNVGMRRYEDVVNEGGVVYHYTVATFDKAGNENRSEPRMATVQDIMPPAQVRNVKAVPDTGVIKLTWFPNPDKDLSGYRIYRMARTAAGGDTILLNARVLKATAFNDTLPKVAKNTFTYFVTAVDTNYNEGPKSAPASGIMPDPEPPQTPVIKLIRKEGETLKIVWLPGMETDLGGYQVFRSTVASGPDSIWKPLSSRLLAPTDTVYVDKDLDAGQTYYYAVRAYDQSENQSGLSAAFMGSVTTMKLRAMAQNVEVKATKSGASISWQMSESQGIIGCMVYRKEGKEAFRPVSGLIQETKCTDTGLKKGNTYYYEVRAFDNAGNFSKSKTVSLTIEEE